MLTTLFWMAIASGIGDDGESHRDTESRVEERLLRRMPDADYVTIMGLTDIIVEESRKIGVAPEIVLGVIHVESRFRVNATSPKNCKGLMQLEPATMAWFAGYSSYEWPDPQIYDPFDNVRIATRYLGYLLDMFGGRLHLALMAYNAGPGKMRRWLRKGYIPGQVRDYALLVEKAARNFSGEALVRGEVSL